jgi:hypothetical protein
VDLLWLGAQSRSRSILRISPAAVYCVISINRARVGTKRAILTTPSILRVVGTGLAGVEDGSRQLVVKNSPRHRNITVTVR